MNDNVKKAFKEIKKEYPNLMRGWGMPRLKTDKKLTVKYVGEGKQFLYGDVSDWIRDYYSNLTLEERDELAKLLSGDFVIKNCLM